MVDDGDDEETARLRQVLANFIRHEYGKWQIVVFHIVKNWLSNFQREKLILKKWQDVVLRDIPQADLLLLGCVFGVETIVMGSLHHRFPFSAIKEKNHEPSIDLQTSIGELAVMIDSRRITTISRALYLAAKWGHERLVRLLLEFEPLDDRDELEDGQSAFHLAISAGSLKATQTLISAVSREHLDASVQNHLTPIGFAIEIGNVEILQLLGLSP